LGIQMEVAMTRVLSAVRQWEEAVRVHAALASGQVLEAVPVPAPGLVREPQEYAVGVFVPSSGAALRYARFCRAEVVVGGVGPTLVVGSPRFLAGYLLGGWAIRRRAYRRAQRAAAAQWRPSPLSRVVVTTRRVWCEVTTQRGRQWVEFPYDAIEDLSLAADVAILTFHQGAPLRLVGAWAPWCAATIAHFRFGPYAYSMLPALVR
jgi:hypothetical protein